MSDNTQSKILPSYKLVWRFERSLHSIGGFKFGFAVPMNELLYFLISLIISVMLIKYFPFYSNLNWAIKFIIVPIGIMKFLTKQKLDGKYPHKFFADWVRFQIESKKYYHFRPIDTEMKFEFATPVVTRMYKVVDRTEAALSGMKGR